MVESAPSRHRVVFTPTGTKGTVLEGTTILDAARDLGVDLDSVCGGRGICGRCQVTPSIGQFAKWSISAFETSLSPPGEIENGYRGRRPLESPDRLGCGSQVVGDVVIDVPARSQIHNQVVRKQIDLGDLELDPIFTLHYLDLDSNLGDDGNLSDDGDRGDNSGLAVSEQLKRALADQWAFQNVEVDPRLLGDVHRACAKGLVTVALAAEKTVVGIWPGFVDQAFGVAVDIGSTTVAGHICDLTTGEILASTGRMNPQIRFGEDLMSRVSYAMMNKGGADAMTACIRQALDELIDELIKELTDELPPAGDDAALPLLDIVAVGNPIMHHLLLGIDPTPLGQAPFPLATADPVNIRATDLGLSAPLARCHLPPCIAGHVGADTTAAIVSEGPHRGRAIQLLVDVGTNAEIVLGNRERLFAASSPTGPAFEGAQISSGQRATTGAIERVRIDRETLEPRYRIIGSDHWSDEPGFDAAPLGGVTGICGSGIIEAISSLFLSGVIDSQGVIGGDAAQRSPRIEPDGRTFSYRLTDTIQVTQADVRAIQLAKAALRAGIELLMEHANLDRVDGVRLAGAFGTHIDPVHAMVLGLIPDCSVDEVRSVGNAAGSGAVRALLSGSQRQEMVAVARSVIKIETATEPRFQEHFVAALAIPHLTAKTPNLASLIELPEATTPAAPTRRRRRKRS